MGRAHVEFIQSQVVPWRGGFAGGQRGAVEAKLLSRDPATGACTAILRYPAGWTREAEYLAADEEFFVIDGGLEIGGTSYGTHAYAYLPAGYARGPAHSPKGAAVLTFFEGEPVAHKGAPPAGVTMDARKLIRHIDTYVAPWGVQLGDPLLRSTVKYKWLRQDPDNGEQTWISAAPPGYRHEGFESPMETHPYVEEMFMLAGELCGNTGRMTPGAYFWRPPGIRHGPYETRLGNFCFFRFKGGPITINWSADKIRYTFDAPYRPALPPELQEFVARPADSVALY